MLNTSKYESAMQTLQAWKDLSACACRRFSHRSITLAWGSRIPLGLHAATGLERGAAPGNALPTKRDTERNSLSGLSARPEIRRKGYFLLYYLRCHAEDHEQLGECWPDPVFPSSETSCISSFQRDVINLCILFKGKY